MGWEPKAWQVEEREGRGLTAANVVEAAAQATGPGGVGHGGRRCCLPAV